ncbi:ANTAR domain-containing protein [Actinoplanes sp. L3-i22]|uniref:ANTAR domain-containing protein n=1 Tax=Actinoplanes sp. L3-i22 TaxID=2836373 RepID=UPI001C786C5F|nr:ANTAR domain-containing protein [Actinoplanes sp. L3-i22]BCY06578.1 GAF domain-containing protein [Actinoplanes sp. L3-i22]
MEHLIAARGSDIDALCRAGLPGLTGVRGLGVTVMTPETQLVWYASDAISARVEQLQFLLGEGPCRDAYTGAVPILAGDLLEAGWQSRWPAFAPAAVSAGARAVFAVPLRVGATGVGALDLYRETAGDLTDATLADALIFADALTELLLAQTAEHPDGETSVRGDTPGGNLLRRAEVHQATGMISVQLGLPVEDALARLRAHAFATGRDLEDLAGDVVTRRIRFNDLDDGEDR